MKYYDIKEASFLSRPNRFVAYVNLQGEDEICHVKNTGRCRELLLPGAKVYLEKSKNPNRKTQYDLVAVEKGQRLINMDAQIPNYVVKEWIAKGNLFSEGAVVYTEKQFGNSRFDIYVEDGERKAFIEVKGVTLENDGIAEFPDAPTLRGVKHMLELIKCKKAGYEAYVIFVIQMNGIRLFRPNWKTHRDFGMALQKAKAAGVEILAFSSLVTPEEIVLDAPVEVSLQELS